MPSVGFKPTILASKPSRRTLQAARPLGPAVIWGETFCLLQVPGCNLTIAVTGTGRTNLFFRQR
jgi:hypothetical protein